VQEWACLNGQLMPAGEARISVFDSGFMQGVGLFETMRAHGGRIFRLERHLARLTASARSLGWGVIPDAEVLREDIEQVLSAVGPEDCRVRLTITTGSLRPAETDVPQLTIVVTSSPGGKYADELYKRGVTVVLSRWRQSRFDPTCGHKTTSYFGRLASLREAHAQGAFEALWLTEQEFVAEGAISSVFVVRGGELLTPPLDTPVLPGITRATVIELARELELPAREQPLRLDDLRLADEAFLTNSMMGVMPVVRLARAPIGTEKPGPLTRRLADAYAELVARECGRA